MNKNRFRLTLFLSIIILLFSLFPAPAYAAQTKDQKAIVKTLEKYNEAVKKYDLKKIRNTLDNKNIKYWIGYPIMQKHIRTLNSKYYAMDIISIKVKGNTAVATTKVTFYNAYDDSTSAMKSTLYDYERSWSSKKTLTSFSKHLKSKYSENLKLYTDESRDFKTRFIFSTKTKIPLVKVNGKWKIQKVTKTMQSEMDAATWEFIEDYLKDSTIIFD